MGLTIGNAIGIPFKRGGQSWSPYWATRTPSNLIISDQTDTTVTLSWTSGAKTPEGYKIKISANGITYTDKAIIDGLATTVTATNLTAGALHYFKLVAYKGTAESPLSLLAIGRTYPDVHDGKTGAWFSPSRPGGARRDANNIEDIYFDMIFGSNQRGDELNTGNTTNLCVYEITACETDHFYSGNKVGDIFVSNGSKSLNDNNKVKQVLGNHATTVQTLNTRPVNGVFDGVNDYLYSPIVLNQPIWVYIVFKQISWQINDTIFNGATGDAYCKLYQSSATPSLRINAGSASVNFTQAAIGEYVILSMRFWGNWGIIRKNLNAQITGFATGTRSISGLFLGTDIGVNFGNFEFEEAIFRSNDDSSSYQEAMILAMASSNKINLGVAAEVMIGFIIDDGAIEDYTQAFPLFESYGCKFCDAISPLNLTNPGMPSNANFLEMQAAGHEIASHSMTHKILTQCTEAELDYEITESYNQLVAAGFNVSTMVYPNCAFNDAVKAKTLESFDYGFTCNTITTGIQKLPLITGEIKRVSITSNTKLQIEGVIDQVIADNGSSVLFLWCHMHDSGALSRLNETLAYIVSKGLITKTPKYILDKIKTYTPTAYIVG